MTTEFIGTLIMNMTVVKSFIKPWTDKDEKIRYYINGVSSLIDSYRELTHTELHSSYDLDTGCANNDRVRQCIEANIIPKTKVFIDEDGHVHVYGYGAVGVGLQMHIPELIEKAVNVAYGYCTEEERQQRMKCIGNSAFNAKIGDTVKIIDGRKEVGKTFVVSKITKYQFNQYHDPSIYLYDADGFKVQAYHCRITNVGYSY